MSETRRQTAAGAETLTRLFRAHAGTAHRLLQRLGVSAGDIDDVLQQVFMVVWRRLEDLRPEASERAWVLAIARKEAANHRRKHGNARQPTAPRQPVTPEEQASGREALRLVKQFIDGLDEPRRIVFHLADVEGMTAPEIAEVTQMNINTVYTRLRAARRAFREFAAAHLEVASDV